MSRQVHVIGSTILIAAFALSACNKNPGPSGPASYGNAGRVSTVDSGTASRLSTSLTGADFKRFAEGMTDKILVSQAEEWSGNKPRLVVGDIDNNTDDENIRAVDIYDGIQEKLLASQTVRVLDRSANDFDYVIKPEITNTRQRDAASRQELVFYTMKMKLYKLDGELVGQWSDDMAFADAGKTWF
ncbi:MAG: hypothetical protein ACRBM6_01205 [Geminicoccales bacterium]